MSLDAQISTATVKYKIIDNALSGDNEIIALVPGKKIRVLAYSIVSAGAATARFESSAGGTALTGQMTIAASTVLSVPFCPVGHLQQSNGHQQTRGRIGSAARPHHSRDA